MAFIGYNTEGYENLAAEIVSRKGKLVEILNSFEEVYAAIDECWIGEDATAYKEELIHAVNAAKSSVTEVYDALSNTFAQTHEEWIRKQGGSL